MNEACRFQLNRELAGYLVECVALSNTGDIYKAQEAYYKAEGAFEFALRFGFEETEAFRASLALVKSSVGL